MKLIQSVFSKSDLEKINAAVAAAEKSTSGEIVVAIARSSAHYTQIPFMSVILGMVAGVGAYAAAPLDLEPSFALLGLGLGAAIGYAAWLLLPDALLRCFVGRRARHVRVVEHARSTFSTNRLEATKLRTGVLIYVSLFERQVVVHGDTAIAKQVPDDFWTRAVDAVTKGLGAGRPAEAVCEAVGLVGAELAKHFPPQPVDVNELPNEVILID